MNSKEIETFRSMVEDKWDGPDRAAFGMVAKMNGERTVHLELYCEGNFDVMTSGIMEEISELIVRNSRDIEEMRHVSMGVSKNLHRLCNEKWAAKTGEPMHFAVLDGGLQ